MFWLLREALIFRLQRSEFCSFRCFRDGAFCVFFKSSFLIKKELFAEQIASLYQDINRMCFVFEKFFEFFSFRGALERFEFSTHRTSEY